MNLFSVFALFIKYGPVVRQVLDEATSNDNIVTKIGKVAEPLVPVLKDLGRELFPNAAPAVQEAGAAVTLDHDRVVWLQKALNKLIIPSPDLKADGYYGPKTRKAVEAFQKDHGLTVDGVAGVITQQVIQDTL